MKKSDHTLIENHMLSCMKDSAHDRDHIYRVLYLALEIAQTEKNVDRDMLICACLLHDIGRGEQFENPKLDHARVGAEKASRFLLENHFPPNFVRKVCDCIRTHRYRAEDPPESLEAKILFDADKLDVTGAVGIARTLLYKGKVSEPLYSLWRTERFRTGRTTMRLLFFRNTGISWCMFIPAFSPKRRWKSRSRGSRQRQIFMNGSTAR